MARMLPFCALLVILPCIARADDAPTETVIRLTVTPAASPAPALRYQLLPELREMNPGNPVQGYLKCFMEQNHFFFDKAEVENREKWQTVPLRDLPVKDLRGYGGGALRQADYAARLETPDWQLLLKLRQDGYMTLLPDVQWLRMLGTGLKVRFRVEVAERRFDDALVTAKTMLALSRCLGEHPTLIGNLVGVAVANLAVDPLSEMIQEPGCPNLYWALTDLPAPFIDLRNGGQGEALIAESIYGIVDEKAPMSDAQWKQAVDQLQKMLNGVTLGGYKGDVGEQLAERAKDTERVRAARTRLIESGLPEAAVKGFPDRQVILLDEMFKYRVRNDDQLKLLALPCWQAEKLQAASASAKGDSLLEPLTPSILHVQQAAARLDQRIALLRCVEALRMYAAENGGKLPAKLDDVKLPLPVDPVTGKPFPYQLDGSTATLRGTPPAGREKDAAFNIRYEVTITK